jgi:zinc transport system permease protein
VRLFGTSKNGGTALNGFLKELATPGSIVQLATLASLIASVNFGVVGTYVVARRITYIAAAIAHSVLAGIGFAVFARAQFDWQWCAPVMGAIVAAVMSALIIGYVSLYLREREDTIISVVWAVGMSVGLLFLYYSPGFNGNLESFLVGSILYIAPSDLWIMGGLGLIVVLLCLFFYNPLLAVCFDEEFARLRGVNVPLYFMLLLVLTSLSVVLLVQLAGIVLAIALIVLPAAAGLHATSKIWHAMVVATVLAMIQSTLGIAWSYSVEIPAGPAIILLSAGSYLAVFAWKWWQSLRSS